ncbi:4Fe-4S double cluster binding domain-containing protein [Alkaliphilus serpentinus]|uniref:Epoxyqueuosine reductase n=1 Tax=Alkaliphilus serpentinus TaxID=1482731 RepID=A0A833M9H5_9FIRM|nr:4Fe-4S double cluster binding domain-containing protein [Alkaliphilus serpentinus]KAB3529865.1 epoxyqueuosine reductase [Alkaliphilus serpentinus]
MKELQEKLLNILVAEGVAKVGFSYVGDLLPERYKHLKSAVTVAIRLSQQIIDDIDINLGPTHTYFHHYRTVNTFIDQTTLKTSNILENWGYLAMAVPASQSINKDGWKYQSLFPHRTAATRSGIGWIGKNSSLVTEEFGPRIRLGTVLTNMEFDYHTPIVVSLCGKCDICVKACPANALVGGLWKAGMNREKLLDPHACSQHMHKAYQHIGRGAVCGICIKACPKGVRIKG